MYLQGDLQVVFDALYHMGVIDPVLDMDWNEALDEMASFRDNFLKILEVVNQKQDLSELMRSLEKFDDKSLGYLAMEVAREFADFHSRELVH